MISLSFPGFLRGVAIVCLSALLTAPARADVVIGGTRVIYPAQEREVTVKLTNDEKKDPRMVQVWIDDGQVNKAPDQIQVPFQLTPPMFRLDAGKGQALRIMYTRDTYQGQPLPTDKESLFWLNVLSVPPKAAAAEGKNLLQFAIRSRIKFFFRPEGLKGRPDQVPAQLTWKLVSNGTEQSLEVHNPSAYHVSFASIALVVNGKDIKSEAPPMLDPGSTTRYPLKGLTNSPPAGSDVHFSTVDDYGNANTYTAKLGPG